MKRAACFNLGECDKASRSGLVVAVVAISALLAGCADSRHCGDHELQTLAAQ